MKGKCANKIGRMNKNESRYFNTAIKMDIAFLKLLEKKELPYISVKEICKEAGVNRSTFYLHYETIDDLLRESVEYMNSRFTEKMGDEGKKLCRRINSCSMEELFLITPQYLVPYLEFIREHKSVFACAVKNAKVLNLNKSYKKMFDFIINPILERYQVPVKDRSYIMSFYINGIMALIDEWLKGDCKETIDEIVNIIRVCIKE